MRSEITTHSNIWIFSLCEFSKFEGEDEIKRVLIDFYSTVVEWSCRVK